MPAQETHSQRLREAFIFSFTAMFSIGDDDSTEKVMSCLISDYEGGDFSDDLSTIFYQCWFNGKATYVLFNKPSNITNISYAETMALIRSNATHASGEDRPVHFSSTSQFKTSVEKKVASFVNGGINKVSEIVDLLTEQYASFFEDVILIDPFDHSVAVHASLTLNVDWQNVCRLSGYIHSVGDLIYCRNIAKADRQAFQAALYSMFLRDGLETDNFSAFIKKYYFIVYCHDYFDEYDNADKIYDGSIDEVKIYLDKFHFEDRPLRDYVMALTGNGENIQIDNTHQCFGEFLYHPPFSKHYAEERSEYLNSTGEETSDALWLLVDKSAAKGAKEGKRYYICYKQRFKNDNQFHVFDEKKPGWIAPITMPHNLAGAMLNIASSSLPKNKEGIVKILDPFCGSGTTLFEASKLDFDFQFIANDLDPHAPYLMHDNLRFFSNYQKCIQEMSDKISQVNIEKIIEHRKNTNDENDSLVQDSDCTEIVDIIPNAIVECWSSMRLHFRSSEAISQIRNYDISKLGGQSERFFKYIGTRNDEKIDFSDLSYDKFFKNRIVSYLILRSIKSNAIILLRENNFQTFAELALSELKSFVHRANSLIDTYNNENGTCLKKGLFSDETYIGLNRIKGLLDKIDNDKILISTKNALDCLEQYNDEIDIIITDPPYGFNTDEFNIADLSNLYTGFIKKSLNALKKGGQLMICLPNIPYNGQKVPYFVTEEVIVRQVLSTAELLKKPVVNRAALKPTEKDLFASPYVWRARKTLSRSILHFSLGE